MALPSTGPLALSLDIRSEELIKNSALPADDVSLREISDSAGFSEPDAMSEFYGYSSAVLPTMASIRLSGGPNDNYMAFAATPATNGFVAITSRGFYFGTDSRGPQYNTRYQVDTSNSLGEFSKGFGSLSASRTYYCWGYVQNQIGEGYTSRAAATTLVAIPVSPAPSTYSGYFAANYYNQQYYDNGSATSGYGWGSRGIAKYYLHPYYGWVDQGSTTAFPVSGEQAIGRNFGNLSKVNNTHTQVRNRIYNYYYSETPWGYSNRARFWDYFYNNDYYMSNSSGPTSSSNSGNGQLIQENNPYRTYGWGLPSQSSTWYRVYAMYSALPEERGPASSVVLREEWSWDGYGYGN